MAQNLAAPTFRIREMDFYDWRTHLVQERAVSNKVPAGIATMFHRSQNIQSLAIATIPWVPQVDFLEAQYKYELLGPEEPEKFISVVYRGVKEYKEPFRCVICQEDYDNKIPLKFSYPSYFCPNSTEESIHFVCYSCFITRALFQFDFSCPLCRDQNKYLVILYNAFEPQTRTRTAMVHKMSMLLYSASKHYLKTLDLQEAKVYISSLRDAEKTRLERIGVLERTVATQTKLIKELDEKNELLKVQNEALQSVCQHQIGVIHELEGKYNPPSKLEQRILGKRYAISIKLCENESSPTRFKCDEILSNDSPCDE